jgi:hypothetical protein
MSKLLQSSTMKVVGKLVKSKKYWRSHFALQAMKFVVWDVVCFQAL